jgi:hypothetical protein
MKEINIIYTHQNSTEIKFQNEQGIVYQSNQRDPNKINVFTSSRASCEPEDSVIVLEPIVVDIFDYDTDNLKRFKYIFGFAEQAYTELGDKFIKINYPADFSKSWKSITQYSKSFHQRSNTVVIIANLKQPQHQSSIYGLRLRLADFLYANNIHVKWYGHNSLDRPYYKGPIEGDWAQSKLEILCNSKFTICSENIYDPIYSENYLTEKMPHAWFASCVPIYMGCHNIDDFGFSPNMYIDLRKYIKIFDKDNFEISKSLLNVIQNYTDSDYQTYLSELMININSNNSFTNITSLENVCKKMIEVL